MCVAVKFRIVAGSGDQIVNWLPAPAALSSGIDRPRAPQPNRADRQTQPYALFDAPADCCEEGGKNLCGLRGDPYAVSLNANPKLAVLAAAETVPRRLWVYLTACPRLPTGCACGPGSFSKRAVRREFRFSRSGPFPGGFLPGHSARSRAIPWPARVRVSARRRPGSGRAVRQVVEHLCIARLCVHPGGPVLQQLGVLPPRGPGLAGECSAPAGVPIRAPGWRDCGRMFQARAVRKVV